MLSPREVESLGFLLLRRADGAERYMQHKPFEQSLPCETRSVGTLRWPGQLHEGGAGLPGKEEQEPREGNVDEWWEVREARSSGVLPKLSVA